MTTEIEPLEPSVDLAISEALSLPCMEGMNLVAKPATDINGEVTGIRVIGKLKGEA